MAIDYSAMLPSIFDLVKGSVESSDAFVVSPFTDAGAQVYVPRMGFISTFPGDIQTDARIYKRAIHGKYQLVILSHVNLFHNSEMLLSPVSQERRI